MNKIVFILNGALDMSAPSGGDRHTVGLIKYCADKGHDVSILAPQGVSKTLKDKVGNAKWVFTERGKLPKAFKGHMIPEALFKYIARTVRAAFFTTIPCDVLYSGSILPHESFIGVMWKIRRVCDKYTVRCDQIFHLEPYGKKPVFFLHRLASKLGMKFCYMAADIIVTMNELVASQWNCHTYTLKYALDEDVLIVKNTQRKDYDVCYFARMSKVKGADLLFDIIEELVGLKPDVRIMLIGDGPLYDKLLFRLHRSNVFSNVRICGSFTGITRFKLLNRCKILLYPTKEDCFPAAINEAMSLGLAVVASDNPHLRSVYGDKAIYTTQYAEQINKLLNDENWLAGQVKKSEAFAKELMDYDGYAEFYRMI